MRIEDSSSCDSEDEDFDPKAVRQKRIANSKKFSRARGKDDRQRQLRAPKNTKPRVKTLKWNSDYDDDDYDEYYV